MWEYRVDSPDGLAIAGSAFLPGLSGWGGERVARFVLAEIRDSGQFTPVRVEPPF